MPPRRRPASLEQEPIIGISMSQMQASMEQSGGRPEAMGIGTALVLFYLYDSIPDPPVSRAAPLASAAAARAPVDGVDRISRLPDEVLKNVVSRLPAKDAARTGALASRWRGIWRSVPLALVDEHILPDGILAERMAPGRDDLSSMAVVVQASRALAAHPGPFRCVHLTWSNMASHQAEIETWLQLLAAKGVQGLVFINRPWPLDLPLPAALFSCTSLTRLCLGVWSFPDTSALPRAARFPNLKEIMLSLTVIKDRDLAVLIERSPVLEVLSILGSVLAGVRLRLVSRSLRCVQVGIAAFADISVVDAPRLQRLFVWMLVTPSPRSNRTCSRIKIGHAPNLRMLGYLPPGNLELELGNTTIKEGTVVNPNSTVSSVQTLALEVQFEDRNEVKMVPCFLKCFPNVETLHIYSSKTQNPTGNLNLKFWQEAGRVECVQGHVKKLVFQEFRGKKSELAFLKFIAEKALVLEKMVIMVASECFSSVDDVSAKLQTLTSARWAREDCKLIVFKSPNSNPGPPAWHFRISSDFSVMDPFDLLTAGAELSSSAFTPRHTTPLR